MVDHLCRKFKESKDIGIAYLYCQYKEREVQSPQNLFASLWRQLFELKDTDPPNEVRELHARHTKACTRATLDEIIVALKIQIWRYSVVYILVDALDECPEDGRVRSTIVQKLEDIVGAAEPNSSRIRLLVTSRQPTTSFPASERIEILASPQDIRSVVSQRITEGISLSGEISSAVRQDKGFRNTIIERITESSDSVTLALKTLRWLVFSFRQLTIAELSNAMAVCPGEASLDRGRIVPIKQLLECCQGLVVVDAASKVVRLAHYTTQQYFDKNKAEYFPNAHIQLTSTCLAYLQFRAFAKGPCDFVGSSNLELRSQKGPIKKSRLLVIRRVRYPFLDYASTHWGDHARSSPSSGTHDESIIAFLQAPKALASSLQARDDNWYDRPGSEARAREQVLSLIVSFGLTSTLSKLINDRWLSFKHVKSRDMEALLLAAANRGWSDMVELFLTAGATMRLELAIPLEDKTIYNHIIDSHVDLEITKEGLDVTIAHKADLVVTSYIETGEKFEDYVSVEESTPEPVDTAPLTAIGRATFVLHRSIEVGELDIARLAIQKGADLEYKDKNKFRSALLLAVYNGHRNIAELVLATGANSNVTAGGLMPPGLAADRGYADLVDLFLDSGESTDSRSRGNSPQDLLEIAVASQGMFKRRRSWIKHFGEESRDSSAKVTHRRISPNIAHTNGLSVEERLTLALHGATEPRKLTANQDFMSALQEDSEQINIIQKLIDRGAEIASVSVKGETLLHLAVGSRKRLEYLWSVESDVLDLNAPDIRGRTPLFYALASGILPNPRCRPTCEGL